MSNLTDRQRIEFSLLPALLFSAFRPTELRYIDPAETKARNHLARAMAEPMLGLAKAQRDKLLRRSTRSHDAALRYYGATGDVGRTQLTFFYALKLIVESDYLVIGGASDLSKAIDILLPKMSQLAQDDARNAEAQADAESLLGDLQDEGLFRGIAIVSAS